MATKLLSNFLHDIYMVFIQYLHGFLHYKGMQMIVSKLFQISKFIDKNICGKPEKSMILHNYQNLLFPTLQREPLRVFWYMFQINNCTMSRLFKKKYSITQQTHKTILNYGIEIEEGAMFLQAQLLLLLLKKIEKNWQNMFCNQF